MAATRPPIATGRSLAPAALVCVEVGGAAVVVAAVAAELEVEPAGALVLDELFELPDAAPSVALVPEAVVVASVVAAGLEADWPPATGVLEAVADADSGVAAPDEPADADAGVVAPDEVL